VACGTLADSCGNSVMCGCSSPQTCGGGGTAGMCGCIPNTCTSLGGYTCGSFPDGCGGMLNCGSCDTAHGYSCGGGTAGKCGCATPNSCGGCAALAGQKGTPCNSCASPNQGIWMCNGTEAVTCQNNCPVGSPICCNGTAGIPCSPTDTGCYCINFCG
jgi:hypothetical protein